MTNVLVPVCKSAAFSFSLVPKDDLLVDFYHYIPTFYTQNDRIKKLSCTFFNNHDNRLTNRSSQISRDVKTTDLVDRFWELNECDAAKMRHAAPLI